MTEAELRAANFGYRAKYIVKTVEIILQNGGTEWVYKIAKQDYADCITSLESLTGIGRKVADCVALYSVRIIYFETVSFI